MELDNLTQFDIQLTSPQSVYYTGQSITGFVILDLKEPMKVRGVEIKLSGEGRCRWLGNEGKGDDDEVSEGTETIIKYKSCLFGSSSALSSKVTLLAGQQRYHFSFTLPAGIPSSYKDSCGRIRYFLIAKVRRPWKFDHKVKRVIKVKDLINPNSSEYRKGRSGEKHKCFGYIFWKANRFDMYASIDRGAYFPGESILITANVLNKTKKNMSKLHAKLCRRVVYRAKGGLTKTSITTISKLKGLPIAHGEFAKWESQPLEVPVIPPTITNSKVLSVEYYLVVKVGKPRDFKASIKLDLVIGTVPYLPTYGQSFDWGDPMAQCKVNCTGVAVHSPPPPTAPQIGNPAISKPFCSEAIDKPEVDATKGDKDVHTYGQMGPITTHTSTQPYQENVAQYDGKCPEISHQYPSIYPSISQIT